MIKNENLYAEEVIVESPFYYDEHGRLRARVLNEEQSLNELSMRGPEAPTKIQMAAMPEKKPDDEISVTRMPVRSGGPAKQKPGLGKIIGGIKRPGIGGIKRPGMDSGNKPRIGAMPRIIGLPKPGIGGVAMPEKKPDATIMPVRDKQAMPMPAVPPSGKVTTDQGFAPGEGRDVARPAVGVKRPGKPLRSFRFSSQSRAGAGRNVNTRAGLRGERTDMRAMAEQALPATEYLEMYEESMVQDQKSMKPTTVTAAPEKAPERKVGVMGGGAAYWKDKEKKAQEFKKNKEAAVKKPVKAPLSKEESRARVQKRTQELKDLRKNNPEGYKAEVERIKKVNDESNAKRAARLEKMKTSNPAEYERVTQKDAERTKKIEGKKAERAAGRAKYVEKLKADYQKKKAAQKPTGMQRQAETNLQEKIDLQKAEMGDVIRDFQKSDAPQFKGKSKAKRRMMAIAAKLQADRG